MRTVSRLIMEHFIHKMDFCAKFFKRLKRYVMTEGKNKPNVLYLYIDLRKILGGREQVGFPD